MLFLIIFRKKIEGLISASLNNLLLILSLSPPKNLKFSSRQKQRNHTYPGEQLQQPPLPKAELSLFMSSTFLYKDLKETFNNTTFLRHRDYIHLMKFSQKPSKLKLHFIQLKRVQWSKYLPVWLLKCAKLAKFAVAVDWGGAAAKISEPRSLRRSNCFFSCGCCPWDRTTTGDYKQDFN